MAGERKGKAYEAVVFVALQELRRAGVFHDPIYWEKTPAGMSIKPDLTIGPCEDSPACSILVTHSSAAGNSHMKFWRNLGELVETKTCLGNVPRVIGLTFGAIKEDLEPIQAWAFDEFRWSRGDRWHQALESLARSLTDSRELATSDFPDEIRRQNPRAILDPMKAILRECLQSPDRPQMAGLWKLHRARAIPFAPSSRSTYVRRGVAKLLVFEDVELGARIHDGERVPKSRVPQYAFDIGLAQKSTCEAWGTDDDIKSAISCLGRKEIVQLAKRSVKPQLEQWYYILRNHRLVPILADYIQSNFSKLCISEWLRERLRELYRDPHALVSIPATVASAPPPTVWLFELLVQLIRASTGSGNGYGYAQLGHEVIETFSLRRENGGVPRIWIGFVSDWVHRLHCDHLSNAELSMIASVLSFRLKAIGAKRVASLCGQMASDNATHVLESKVIPYRGLDPLGELVHAAIPEVVEFRIDVCYREAAGVGGQAGRMMIGKSKKTLINWQSAHDSHTNDKKKELCGRAVGLRYHWNGSKFVRRPGVEKLILLLDGTWKDDDLKALLRAGWDEIYYPDEVDRLKEMIV